MQVQEMARDKQINFRVSEEEAARFDLVAEHYGLAVSAAIRMLVKREAERLTGARVTVPNEEELYAKACRIMRRRAEVEGGTFVQPSRSASGIETKGSRTFFSLRNSHQLLARFRVTASGDLRKLKD
jgi:antitoxin component of RelBE/YafQ-DinJ toxin-antitoxin module